MTIQRRISQLATHRRILAGVACAFGAITIGLINAPAAQAATHTGPNGVTVTDSCWTLIHSTIHDDPSLPDKGAWCQTQFFAAEATYRGPVDGVMGTNSWNGYQHFLHDIGFYSSSYSGTEDTATQKAMQRYAATSWIPYRGPVDGVMGPNSWKSLTAINDQNWVD